MTSAWQSGHYKDALKTARELADKGKILQKPSSVGPTTPGSALRKATRRSPVVSKSSRTKKSQRAIFPRPHVRVGPRRNTRSAKGRRTAGPGRGASQCQAEIEAAGMRMEGEAAAQQARCLTDGPLRLVGGMAIDPY
jgi:hypothetical protein